MSQDLLVEIHVEVLRYIKSSRGDLNDTVWKICAFDLIIMTLLPSIELPVDRRIKLTYSYVTIVGLGLTHNILASAANNFDLEA